MDWMRMYLFIILTLPFTLPLLILPDAIAHPYRVLGAAWGGGSATRDSHQFIASPDRRSVRAGALHSTSSTTRHDLTETTIEQPGMIERRPQLKLESEPCK